MTRLREGPMGERDIEEYLRSEADFAFEMQVLNGLNRVFEELGRQGFESSVEHGGTYTDPVTKKPREFDIRLRCYDVNRNLALWLSVECKNIKENSPLLLSCIPRRREESFHSVVRHVRRDMAALVWPVSWAYGYYAENRPVAKSVEQIGRTTKNTPVGSDARLFEKLSQAINSAYDLVWRATRDRRVQTQVIVPVLVVPDDRLWQVDFNAAGQRIGAPRLVARGERFSGHSWTFESGIAGGPYTISHLEMVTVSALGGLFADHLDPHQGLLSYSILDELAARE